VLMSPLTNLVIAFNDNKIWDKPGSIKNGKIALFFALKWDKNTTQHYVNLLITSHLQMFT
jgi:hypothetical protein